MEKALQITRSRQYIASLIVFLGCFSVGLITFSVEGSSWWEPGVGSGIVALTFSVFGFYVMRYPKYLLSSWAVLVAILTFQFIRDPYTECITSDFCTSSPFVLAVLQTTFFLDLALLLVLSPGVLIPLLLRTSTSIYAVFGALGTAASGVLLLLYLAIDSLMMRAYDGVMLTGIGLAYVALLVAGLREKQCGAWLEKHKKLIAILLLVSIVLFGTTIPFGE